MENTRTFIFFTLTMVLTVSICYFINKSNDHIECETETSTKIDKNGNEVLLKRHICREKYSL